MKNKVTATVAVVILLAAVLSSMLFGSVGLSPSRIMGAVSGTDRTAAVILFELRLPRMLASLLAGAALAVAGLILQTITDNDLCAPSIIGVNSGAGLAVMVMLCLFPMAWRLLPLAAFAGALGTSFIVLTVSRCGKSFEKKSTIVLAGVAVSAIMSAGISFLSIKYPDVLSSYNAFSVGGFSGVTMKQLTVPSVIIILGIIAAILYAPKISLLCLGSETAASLGVQVKTVYALSVVISAALCASAVSFAGLLGFVGLVVPHIVRRLIKGNLRAAIPFTACVGAILVTLSDTVGRVVIAPSELPAGIIMSFVGAPFFIYLLIRRKNAG